MNVTWLRTCLGMHNYVDIVNVAVETSFQYMTTLTVSPYLLIYFAQAEGKSIYFRSGKSEADDSFEVYHSNRLKEIIGYAFQNLAKGIPVLRFCANAFTALNQTTYVFELVK